MIKYSFHPRSFRLNVRIKLHFTRVYKAYIYGIKSELQVRPFILRETSSNSL